MRLAAPSLQRTALAAALLALVACAPGSTPGGAAERATEARATEARAAAELVAAGDVRHAGVRRVDVFDEAGVRTLGYRERVLSDGEGRFSLRPLEALTPVPGDWTFRQLNREGYLFRYRDFAVRQPAWFAANWSLAGPDPAEPPASIAGRDVAFYRAERRVGEPRTFELWVDRELGLPLRIDELADHDGLEGGARVLRSRVQYERFDAAPDLSGAVWFEGVHDERALDARGDLEAQVGRPVPRPKRLPAGFRLLEASTLQDAGGEWVKLTYSDGAETFFYLHQAPATRDMSVAGEVHAAAGGGELFLHRMGAAGVAQATLDEGTFLAVGKVVDDELVDAIESALP